MPSVLTLDSSSIILRMEDSSRLKTSFSSSVTLMRASDIDAASADIAATAAALRALPGVVGKIATVGFCWGGRLSYLAAASGVVDAAVAYYGGGIQHDLGRADDVTVPLLMHFGAEDSHIPAAAVQQIAERFDDKMHVEIHVYPGAEHGFNCSHRASYQQRAAAHARGNSLIFLSENL